MLILLLISALGISGCSTASASPSGAPSTTATVAQPSLTQTPAVSAPFISHTLVGHSDCLKCHSSASSQPVPGDHTGYTNNSCTNCHKTR